MRQNADYYRQQAPVDPPVEEPLLPTLPDGFPSYEGETRLARVRLAPGLEPLFVEVPVVESRFIGNFREPSTDVPGLVMTDSGDVYLVNPDGTRTLLNGGGGTGLPTGWTQDASDPANVNANGGTLILGGGTFGQLPLLVVGDNSNDRVIRAQNFDEQDLFVVDQDFGGAIAFGQFGVVGSPFDTLDLAPSGATPIFATRSSIPIFQVDTHGQTTVGAIDALPNASLQILPQGEAEGVPLVIAYSWVGGDPVFKIADGGNTQLVPTADVTPLDIHAHTGGQTANLLNLWDTNGNPVVEARAEGSVLIAPGGDDTYDSLTVFYSLPTPGSSPALRVGNAVGGVRAVIMDTAEANEFSVCFDGSSLFLVRVEEAIPKVGFFDVDPVPQQAAPSSAQDIANALAAYGLLVGAGTVPSGGLPTGWTEDASDPANVTSHDGSLDLNDGALSARQVLVGVDGVITSGGQITSGPSSGAAFVATDALGATVALDADSLPVENVADPVSAQDAATKHYVDTHDGLSGPIRAGVWYPGTDTGTTQTSGPMVNAEVYCLPYRPITTHHYDQIGCVVQTAGSSGSVVRLGIYADDGTGKPGVLIVDAGTIDGTITGLATLSINVTLNAGALYWLALSPQGSPVTGPRLVVNNLATLPDLGTQINFGIVVRFFGWQNTGVTGALANPFVGNFYSTYSHGLPAAVMVHAD